MAWYGVLGSSPAHRWPPCEPFSDGVDCTAILWTLALVKYHHAYSYRCDLYPTAILPNLYHSLTSPTHDWTSAHCAYCGLGCEDLSRCSLAEYKYSYYYYVKDTYHRHCHCSHCCHYHLDCAKIVCPMWSATVPHQLYPVKKLTPDTPAGDVGSQGDCCAVCGISTTIIYLPIIMDPVTFLLLFNITVWLYWTVKWSLSLWWWSLWLCCPSWRRCCMQWSQWPW